MKVITVANQKGGVGKTAVACHLAFHLRDAGRSVLFIDLDPQGNASSTLAGEAQGPTEGVVASALFEKKPPALPALRQGITLVQADMALTELERGDVQSIQTFRDNLQDVASQYDFAVIDTAPTFGLRMTAALVAADFVLSPIELESYSIQGITRMLQTIFGVQERYNPGLTFLGMLPNRFNGHSQAQRDNLKTLLGSYANLMVAAKIGNRSSIAEALQAGVPVWELPKTAAREAGREMREAFALIESKMEVHT